MDVVVVGSCNVDQISYASRLPLSGETIRGHKYEIGFGGKGANQCVAAAKLGARCAMVARVGDDENGNNYISNMRKLEIDVSRVLSTVDVCTGIAAINVGADGSNSIVIIPGANSLLTPDDVDSSLEILTSAKVLLCQLEVQTDTTVHAMMLAKQAGITTIFNPAPTAKDLMGNIYQYCDILCPNETEASALSGIDVTDVTSATLAAEKLKSKGCTTCIITMGKEGCVVATEGDTYHVPSKPVSALDTTGAGDAFLGALAYFICYYKHLSLKEIIERACIVAAESVRKRGTQTSFPLRKDLPSTLFH